MTKQRGSSIPSKSKKSLSALTQTEFFQEEVNRIIENEQKNIRKNPKTISKWLTKLKHSITKKVTVLSRASQVSSQQESMDELQAKKRELEKKIQAQLQNIKVKAASSSKRNTDFTFTKKFDESSLQELESKGSHISEKYTSIAQELGAVKKKMQTRSDAIANTLELVEKKIQDEGSATNNAGPIKPVPLKPSDGGIKYGLRNLLRSP